MTELEALVALNQLPKIGPVRIRNLMAFFGSAKEVLNASAAQVEEVQQCNKQISEVLTNWQKLSDTQRELRECERNGVQIVTPSSTEWPKGLREYKDAPVLLYVWGTLNEYEDHSPVAVIGSRKTTNYGRLVTQQLSRQLAHSGHTIISGLALGIDTVAHQAALDSGQRTIAVLGSGLAAVYPRQNRELAERISQQGAVVSEYSLFTNPDKQTFPQRNRIVAAWADATVVTEMPERSGAMITAQFAREMGRPIFAVPGPIDRPSSAGCNLLIQQGAGLITDARQVSEALHVSTEQMDLFQETNDAELKANMDHSGLDSVEKALIETLTSHEQSIEEIHGITGIDLEEMSVALFNLELTGMIKQHPGMTYTIS